MTIAKQIKWEVAKTPTGRYRAFERRNWPSAFYKNEEKSPCGDIQCADDYNPTSAKSGEHAPLTVRICDYSAGSESFTWITLKTKHAKLADAKLALETYIECNPRISPKK